MARFIMIVAAVLIIGEALNRMVWLYLPGVDACREGYVPVWSLVTGKQCVVGYTPNGTPSE